ncbi:MAG: hypothetical protein GX569_11800 [Candidatus Riflebacteria bacterium]|nr:hypothetical protein [Candidatus Riflebacteria bacterium]
MTTAYYCMGGGLGHITRFAIFCRHFTLRPALLTNCGLVRSGMIKPDAGPIMIPDEADSIDLDSFRTWISNAIECCRPDTLIIDAFPGGILGELCDLPALKGIKCIYLARILDLSAYQSRLNGALPAFTKIYRIEQLGDEQQNWLQTLQAPVEELTLPYNSRPVDEKSYHIELPYNCWLIVHSGSIDELEQLWQFACQTAEVEELSPNFAMVSPGKKPEFLPETVAHYNCYPADSLIEQADRIFSAAGFNIMQQMKGRREKHLVMPMKRALDDQFLRCRLANQR